MRDDPADDWDRYCAGIERDPRRPLYLCVECRGYMPRERLPGERDGGFMCDECCSHKAAAE